MSLDAIATSAFGRRPVTHAQIQAQLAVQSAREEAGRNGAGSNLAGAVNKWTLFRTLTEIRDDLAISDRALGVLNALLTFHPETALTLAPPDGEGDAYSDLVVYPSNRALSLRANGMSEPTLRRHIAALVEAGLIIRRDSPNGKRYARKPGGADAPPAQAFGFDLAPLVARQAEFADRLEALRQARRDRRRIKERVSLLRRDVTKRLAYALDEGLPGDWEPMRLAFLELCGPARRARSDVAMQALEADLRALLNAVSDKLRAVFQIKNSNGDADQTERHMANSNPESQKDFEPTSKEAGGGSAASCDPDEALPPALPLAVVLDACRDVSDYHVGPQPIADWSAFVAAIAVLRPMLGISPDAWRCAVDALGARDAAVAVAFILQRCEHSSEAQRDPNGGVTVNGSPAIRSPGGYLRALTEKGRGGGASLWPAILAHLAQRLKHRGARTGGEGRAADRFMS